MTHGERADRWAKERGLELTAQSRPTVASYLRSARVLRIGGGVAGAVLPSLFDLVFNGRVQVLGFGTDGENAPLGFGTIFVGYLLGALLAEIRLSRPVPGARRMAALSRRELEDYLPRRIVVAQRALAVTGALGTLAIGLVPYDDDVSTPGVASLAAGALFVLALVAGLEAIERWLVRRPQPFTGPDLIAADDAIRAQSLHAVAGAGLALLLLYCCGIALVLQASEVAFLRTAMIVPAAAFLILSLLACREISAGSWRVRRSVTVAGAA